MSRTNVTSLYKVYKPLSVEAANESAVTYWAWAACGKQYKRYFYSSRTCKKRTKLVGKIWGEDVLAFYFQVMFAFLFFFVFPKLGNFDLTREWEIANKFQYSPVSSSG